ncbi:MAG: DegV family protein [Prolixibacteraceae bacterium]
MKNNQPVYQIDGRYLYYTFLAGAHKVLQNQSEINSINVFPVNDKDTGTNLASTVRSIMDSIRPDRSFTATAGVIAEAALVGARGNSGVIFAQFFHGLSLETNNRHVLSFSEFAEIIKKSVRHMYQAVSNPVEGTMLTVMSDWADFLYSRKEVVVDFDQAFLESLETLKKSLSETKEKLLILKKMNLVDAGAKGFVVFIEGIIELIRSKNLRHLMKEVPQIVSLVHSEEVTDEVIEFRYCTEALIRNLAINQVSLQNLLQKYGNSIVVAGAEKTTRIHIHTNSPAKLFQELKDFGTITSQKVDDMVRQNEVSKNRKWNIAVVTDSTCDLSQDLIDFYQIHVLPLNLNFGENHYLDKVTITPDEFYDLLDSNPEFPRTSLINERTFTNLYSQLATHYDAIIAIHLSGHFSGTLLNSQKAAARIAQEFNKEVHVFDSKSLSGALGLLVLRTAQAIESGESLNVILGKMDDWISKTRIYVSVKTMKYMVKGGRVSKPKGFITSLLNIKPIVSLDQHGKAILLGKTFSQPSNVNLVMKKIESQLDQTKIWNYVVLHAHNQTGANEYSSRMQKLTGVGPVATVDISPAIGMNAGVGATAVSIMLT